MTRLDSTAKRLIERGDALFGKRSQLLSLWQELAENFYVERANFTYTRNLGDEFSDHLMSSYPLMVRRDLGNAFSSMLRQDEWFKLKLSREDQETHDALKWLEYATGVQRRVMYDRRARFVRATKEGDHDFATFGQCVLSAELNKVRNGLLFRAWHLKDCAWSEGYDGSVNEMHRKWKPSAKELVGTFGKQVHAKVKEKAEKHPHVEIECRHIVLPADDMNEEGNFRSLFVDVENQHTVEDVEVKRFQYVVPRWQTVSGSQYAFSPATVAALPDARLLQSMTGVLLTAGEKYVDPPMLAVQEAIRSDVDIRRGGITWVDHEYDERLGEVLRPLSQDKSGFPAGFSMEEGIRGDLAEAFYLSKLSLPIMAGDMTATEVSQRVEEYIRQSLPLFEPMEMEYNGQLCDLVFNLLLDNNAFGNTMPDSLANQEVEFQFESPLRTAIDRKDGVRYREALELTAMGSEMEASLPANVDFHEALRDALEGVGVKQTWLADEEQVEEAIKQAKQQQEIAQVAEAIGA